jgi:phospholipase/carboxylesterase
MGEYGHRLLAQLGLPIEWHRYPMAHTVTSEEVADIRAWLVRVLAV